MKNTNPIIAIFAIIGALVILGLLIRTVFALIGIAIVIGAVLVIFYFVRQAVGRRS